jgi:hypothetical protein
VLVGALASVSCEDMGRPVAPAPDSGAVGPRLIDLVPARTVPGDTILVVADELGAAPGGRGIAFARAAGGSTGAQVIEWTSSSVRVVVPADAATGDVVVVGGQTPGPAGLFFELAPRLVPYAAVDSVFSLPQAGCKSCHTGLVPSGSLDLGTREALLSGASDHGPVVVRRRGPESILVRKLRGTAAFGDRMPQGGDPLPDAAILVISDWIDQGTRP